MAVGLHVFSYGTSSSHSTTQMLCSFATRENGGESKGCLIKGCLNSTKILKVGIPKAEISTKTGIPKAGIPKVGKTHTGTLPKTEIPKRGIPKSGIPKTGIPKAEIPKLGIPKTGGFTAPLIQTPLRLPLRKRMEDQGIASFKTVQARMVHTKICHDKSFWARLKRG